ncbi:MAG: hypothetical protein ABW252_19150 [Polyangiales bacterium]
MTKPARSTRVRLVALCTCVPLRWAAFLAIAMFACAAAIPQAAGANEFHDAQFLSAYERHALLAVARFAELPLWDPYACGGMYGLAAPQTRYASPFFLLTLLFDVDRGAVLAFVLLPAIGMEGMYRYARRWGALALPAFLWAPAFPLSGFFALSFQYGWVQFLSFCLVPWILLGLRGALRGDARAAFLCAVAVGVTVGFGGTYTLPMAMVLALCELGDAIAPRIAGLRAGRKPLLRRTLARLGTAARGLAVLLPLALGMAAYRLWPMLESVEATLRTMGGTPSLDRAAIFRLVFVPAPGEDTGHFFASAAFLLLALLAPWRGRIAAYVAAALSFALAFGHAHALAPFALLRKLPLYDTLRYPERYLLLFVLAASLLGALGATRLLALARRFGARRVRAFAHFLLAVLAAVGIAQARGNITRLVAPVALEPTPLLQHAEFRQSRGNRWLMRHFAPEGMGSLACGEAYPVPMSSHLRGDLQSEEYLVGSDGGPLVEGVGIAAREAWSPHRIAVRVDARAPVKLAINQNHHPGWRASVGDVASWDGLLSVDLPAGQHLVVLRFLPRSGIAGALASLVTLIAGGLYALRRPRARLRAALALAAGPLVVVLALLVWPEPRWRRPTPRTESGDAVLLAELPPEATRLRARFDVPLVLEGVRVPSTLSPVASEVPLELFFRRTGNLSASVGIFVHMMGPHGSQHGDHATLSGVVYLPRLPTDTLGRDAFRVALPANATGLWTVRVGLWEAYGSGKRIHVLGTEGARVEEHAVVVGQFEVPPHEGKAASAKGN